MSKGSSLNRKETIFFKQRICETSRRKNKNIMKKESKNKKNVYKSNKLSFPFLGS